MVKIEAATAALQVLEAIRATNPALIADHMPDGWGMNKLRKGLQIQTQFDGSGEDKTMDAALVQLNSALVVATETGLFDKMVDISHPDIINRFCDAVAEFKKHTEAQVAADVARG